MAVHARTRQPKVYGREVGEAALALFVVLAQALQVRVGALLTALSRLGGLLQQTFVFVHLLQCPVQSNLPVACVRLYNTPLVSPTCGREHDSRGPSQLCQLSRRSAICWSDDSRENGP